MRRSCQNVVREAAAHAESAVPRNRAANQNTPISFINFGSLAAGHQALDVTRESNQTSIVSCRVVSEKNGQLKIVFAFS